MSQEDKTFDHNLRPRKLKEFVGQKKLKENLDVFLQAASQRKESLEHVLFYGGPGLGKTTLAYILGNEIETKVHTTTGPALERVGDMAAILTNLGPRDILFIDEIHRLPFAIEEMLYKAMEEFVLDLILGKGPSAKMLRIKLAPFTLIGATIKINLLSAPLRDRFGMICHLNFYELEDVCKIIERSSRILNISLTEEVIKEIAFRSRKTPRAANRLLKRVRDYIQVEKIEKTTPEVVRMILNKLEIDDLGLDAVDRRLLEAIIKKFRGGPVGLKTLAAATGEEIETIENIYEPYLLQIGFLERTPRGRVATTSACQHLNKTLNFK